MARSTIDYGIDLGTTNSAIALLRGATSEIIKDIMDRDTTPSAVFIDKRGQVHVGEAAKDRLEDQASADDAYVEFKRRMGTDHKYQFRSSKREMGPEGLSAEVLKSLRANVRDKTGEEISSAVITVPAAFEQRQCAATKLAGEMAGFTQCPLLQEPVAAALAFGYQTSIAKEYWLVYDFGGGTFDAAIVKAEDGSIAVVNHGGNNFLGGSDIDWAIVDKLVLPALNKTLNVRDLTRANPEWKTAIAVIKRSVERAKIQLSQKEETYLDDCKIRDSSGEVVEVDFKLTRSALIAIAEPIILSSVDICKRVLLEKRLGANAINKVVLVGGPTKAPYFREILQQGLGIPLDFSVDPLTVVARGAAVFAGTQRVEGATVAKAASGQYDVALKHKTIGPEDDPTVTGVVSAQGGGSVEGFTVEITNQKTHWRSGKLVLKKDGLFKVNVIAEKGSRNTFSIALADPTGGNRTVVPSTFEYTVGMTISEQTIINSIGVALASNEVETYFAKGNPLPAKKTINFKTSRPLKKGESASALTIAVVEGEQSIGDRNLLLGSLQISGSSVRRDVPAQTEIEVTLQMDASRTIRVKAYVPFLDEEFDAVLTYNATARNVADLQAEFDAEMKRLGELRKRAKNADETVAYKAVDQLAQGNELANLLDVAHADPDAALKAERQLLDMKIKLDEADNAVKWPALVAEARQAVEDVEAVLAEHGTPDQQGRFEKLRALVEDFIAKRRTDQLTKTIDQLQTLQFEVWRTQPSYWVGLFEYFVEQRHRMQGRDLAERLINQGRKCIDSNNLEGLRIAVNQLRELLPNDEAESIERGYKSTIIK